MGVVTGNVPSADTGRSTGAERRLRQLLLIDPGYAVDRPRLDECAAYAAEVEATETAGAVLALSALERGYGTAGSVDGAASMTERARKELAALMRRVTPGEVAMDAPALVEGEQPSDRAVALAIEACGVLDRCLADAQPTAELDALLDRLATELVPTARIDLTQHTDAPIGRLLGLFAARGLQDFLRANHDLAFAPIGSAALFHASARFDSAGLGCYLRNVRHVTRQAGDVIGLVSDALRDAGLDHSTAERWIVPLAPYLQDWKLGDLVSLCGDLLWLRASRGLLRMVERRMQGDGRAGVLWRLRDNALDNADMDVAIHAQWLAATLLVHSAAEWMQLGDLRAMVGDRDGARRDYLYAQGLTPDDNLIQQRLDQLDEGREVENVGGYGSLPGQRLRRLVRAGLIPPDPLPMIDRATR
jgi:hypothetical protein